MPEVAAKSAGTDKLAGRVRVEFFGVPRRRAGVAFFELELDAGETNLGQVLAELARHLPDFGAACLNEGALRADYVASLNGDRFVRDLATPLLPGSLLLILSADAGG